jgi:heme/copper-type cytochrome/quinol oxidase subunit 2
MKMPVRVLEKDEFTKWLREQKRVFTRESLNAAAGVDSTKITVDSTVVSAK